MQSRHVCAHCISVRKRSQVHLHRSASRVRPCHSPTTCVLVAMPFFSPTARLPCSPLSWPSHFFAAVAMPHPHSLYTCCRACALPPQPVHLLRCPRPAPTACTLAAVPGPRSHGLYTCCRACASLPRPVHLLPCPCPTPTACTLLPYPRTGLLSALARSGFRSTSTGAHDPVAQVCGQTGKWTSLCQANSLHWAVCRGEV